MYCVEPSEHLGGLAEGAFALDREQRLVDRVPDRHEVERQEQHGERPDEDRDRGAMLGSLALAAWLRWRPASCGKPGAAGVASSVIARLLSLAVLSYNSNVSRRNDESGCDGAAGDELRCPPAAARPPRRKWLMTKVNRECSLPRVTTSTSVPPRRRPRRPRRARVDTSAMRTSARRARCATYQASPEPWRVASDRRGARNRPVAERSRRWSPWWGARSSLHTEPMLPSLSCTVA